MDSVSWGLAMRLPGRIFCASILLLTAMCGRSETSHPRLTFDVAAIHPSATAQRGGEIKPLPNGNGYIAHNVTVKLLMSVMYRIPSRQISGGPAWFESSRFDVEAKTDHTCSLNDLHTMFKNLLADRFGLKFHQQVKEGPVYALIISKSGVKMKPDGAVSQLNVPIVWQGPGDFVGTKVPLEYLCWFLGQQIQVDPRPVIDKTGLIAVYDFTLKFAPELSSDGEELPPEFRDLPALREALQEQLGLQLKPEKGPIPIFVIDHIEMPSEN